jgi:predicted  nucleic acid-binding Zn-ribbon protein
MDKLSVETSTVETFKPGKDKDNYLKNLEDNLDKLKSMIDDMKEKSINLENDVKTEFEQETEKLQHRYDEAKSRLNDIRQSGGGAWTELHNGVLNAWRDLTKGIKSAISKF